MTLAEMEAMVEEAIRLGAEIRPFLAGRPHQVQGAVIADLLATFLGGFYLPSVRETILRHHLLAVREMLAMQNKGLVQDEDVTWQ